MLLQPLYPIEKKKLTLKHDLAEAILDLLRDHVEDQSSNGRDDKIRKSILIEVHNSLAKKINQNDHLKPIKLALKTHECIALNYFLSHAAECHFSYRISLDQIAAQIDSKI